jgi:hypothetical protein
MRKTTLSVSALGALFMALVSANAVAETPAQTMHSGEGDTFSETLASHGLNQSRDLANGGAGPQMAGGDVFGATGGLGGVASDSADSVVTTASVTPGLAGQAAIVRSAHAAGGSNRLAGLDTAQLFALAGLSVSSTGLATASPPNMPFNAGAHAGGEIAAGPVLAASTLADGVWRIGADASNALISAGLKPGDIVLSVNGIAPAAVLPTLSAQSLNGPVEVVLRRDGAAQTILTVDPKVVADALARFQSTGDGRS